MNRFFIRSIVANQNDYPEVSANEKRFLNSGGMMGYITDLIEIINLATIKDDDDDQLYYTKIFLNQTLRVSFEFNKFKCLQINQLDL